jgi:flagellar biosynthetic protein FlhB
MAEDLGDKTEDPTPKRLEDAREKGQVIRSLDLASAVVMLAAFLALLVFGASLTQALGGTMSRLLALGHDVDAVTTGSIPAMIKGPGWDVGLALLPVLAVLMVASYIAHVGQFGFLFTSKPLNPDLSRINPVNGLQKLFGAQGAIRSAGGTAKLIFVAIVGFAIIMRELPAMASLSALTAAGAMLEIGKMLVRLVIWLLVALIVLGIIDYLLQRMQHMKQLRMTKQEVKEERKSMDGDPQIKARRMRIARQIAMQQMQRDVPRADVIVTNPTHFAVAIQYDQATMAAPKVVAKGADLLALRIRQIAAAHAIPIVERPPLARALYAGIEVGQEISPEHYQAVAEVLAYVYKLEKAAAA